MRQNLQARLTLRAKFVQRRLVETEVLLECAALLFRVALPVFAYLRACTKCRLRLYCAKCVKIRTRMRSLLKKFKIGANF